VRTQLHSWLMTRTNSHARTHAHPFLRGTSIFITIIASRPSQTPSEWDLNFVAEAATLTDTLGGFVPANQEPGKGTARACVAALDAFSFRAGSCCVLNGQEFPRCTRFSR